MTWELILQILTAVGTVGFGFLVTYFKTKGKLGALVTDMIAYAEEMYKDTTGEGGKKKELVIETLYEYVPVALKPFITKAFVENLVQQTFESIQEYAVKQLDKVVDKAIEKITKETVEIEK